MATGKMAKGDIVNFEELELLLSRKIDGDPLTPEQEEALAQGMALHPELAAFESFGLNVKDQLKAKLAVSPIEKTKLQTQVQTAVASRKVQETQRRWVRLAATFVAGATLFYLSFAKPWQNHVVQSAMKADAPITLRLEKEDWMPPVQKVAGGAALPQGMQRTLWIAQEPEPVAGPFEHMRLEIERVAPADEDKKPLTYR